MKKTILLVILILVMTAALFGCTTPDVPGSAWAQKETLVYDVAYKNADGTQADVFGTMTSVLERVSGKSTLVATGKEYTVSANTSHFTMETKDINGVVIMQSEFIMDGFKPVASYKMVKFGDKDYNYCGEYGAKYVYTYTNNKTGETVTDGKISLSGTYMDNEFMYMYIRCYTLETDLNKTFNILNPTNGSSEAVAVKTYQSGKKPMKLPNKAEEVSVDITTVSITRTTVPVGASIYVQYTNYDAATDILNFGSSATKDYHIPVRIDENDVVYVLQSENIQVILR